MFSTLDLSGCMETPGPTRMAVRLCSGGTDGSRFFNFQWWAGCADKGGQTFVISSFFSFWGRSLLYFTLVASPPRR
ncbi:hypothetical protein C8P63_105132 [Melghirimyces profundicolus]|uniref:Uncharacterized protein n=1 Tax=Melghirimyces profundicolus TaxID=1242148 RepID=A0A2T6C2R3_9BACL|nr:hypothetical protein C8P63_105132 [Melghirimyces profundicolus]